MNSHPTIINSKVAADLLGIKPQTLRKWRHRGTGPRFIRLGSSTVGRVVYRVLDVEKWLEDHTFGSTAEETVAR